MICRDRFVIRGIGLCSGEIGLWSVGSVCDLGGSVCDLWGSVYDLGRSVCDLGGSRTRIVLCIAGGTCVEVDRSVVHSAHSHWAAVIVRGSLRGAGSAT